MDNLWNIDMKLKLLIPALLVAATLPLGAQKYKAGLIDKTVAVVGGEVIMISDMDV